MKSIVEFYKILLEFLAGRTNKQKLLQAYPSVLGLITLKSNGEDVLDDGYATFHRASESIKAERVARITEAIVKDLGEAVITDDEASRFFFDWCEQMIPEGVTYRCHHNKGTNSGPGELIVSCYGAQYPQAKLK